MASRVTSTIINLAILFALIAFNGAALANNSITIGVISDKPLKEIKRTQPLADFLTQDIYGNPNGSGVVKLTTDRDQMGEWLKSGEVDMVSDTIFTSVYLQEHYDAEIALLRWKKGVGTYKSVFITNITQNIESLEDLIGKVILFEDSHSSSSFYIPAAILLQKGYDLIQLDNVRSPVPYGKIGYVFVKEELPMANELSLAAWVFRGQAHAGAYSDNDWNDYEATPSSFKEKLKIFHTTISFPRSLMLYSSTLNESFKQKITRALLNADQTNRGSEALKRFQKTTQFNLLNNEQKRAIEHVSDLTHIINTELKL